jgi:hypothetical protein
VDIKVEVRVMDYSAIGEHMTDRDLKLSGNAVAMVPDPDYYLRMTYHTRCKDNEKICKIEEPDLIGNDHKVACHLQ